MQETKSVFAVMTQQANSSPVSGKTITIHVEENEVSQVKHQDYAG